MKKKILVGLLVVFIIIQFFRPDTAMIEFDSKQDFFYELKCDSDIKRMIKDACYDCHSYETNYPWYSQIAPFSWWLQDHIEHGRQHLNFSVWKDYEDKKAKHKLEECSEMIETGEMPLKSYLFIHKEAYLSSVDTEKLTLFFNKLRSNY